MQAYAACAEHDACFTYQMEERNASAEALMKQPGVSEAVACLGYSDSGFVHDVTLHPEAIYLVSTFCVQPPGATQQVLRGNIALVSCSTASLANASALQSQDVQEP